MARAEPQAEGYVLPATGANVHVRHFMEPTIEHLTASHVTKEGGSNRGRDHHSFPFDKLLNPRQQISWIYRMTTPMTRSSPGLDPKNALPHGWRRAIEFSIPPDSSNLCPRDRTHSLPHKRHILNLDRLPTPFGSRRFSHVAHPQIGWPSWLLFLPLMMLPLRHL